MNFDTETIDRLFLELSQFTKATTRKEKELLVKIHRVREILTTVKKENETQFSPSAFLEALDKALSEIQPA